MNGPAIDEAGVEDWLDVRAFFERQVTEGRLFGPGEGDLRDVLRTKTQAASDRRRFYRACDTLRRRGPDSAWARRQFRLLIGGRDDTEAA